jgi:hypothetical protein
MKGSLIGSLLLHVLLLCALIFGLPLKPSSQEVFSTPIPVELIPVGPETQAFRPVEIPKPSQENKELEQPKVVKTLPTTPPEKETPKEEPVKEEVKKPETFPPVPPLEPSLPEDPQEDRSALEAMIQELEKAPPLDPKPESLKKPEKPKEKTKGKAKEKPKPKKEKPKFDSVLKNIMKNKEEGDMVDPKESRDGSSSSQTGKLSDQLTISEMDLIRQQISKCWNIPAGARDAQNLIVNVKVWMNMDGTVKEVRLENTGSSDNPFYRTASESALRAVQDQRCLPLKLPLEKYDQWKVFVLTFNPKDLL